MQPVKERHNFALFPFQYLGFKYCPPIHLTFLKHSPEIDLHSLDGLALAFMD